MNFTHLHVHTDYSLLDGVLQIPQLIDKLQEIDMKACALTDHGNLYGTYKFLTAMRGAGLKPILGSEIYIAPRSMDDKEYGIDNDYYHLVLLAKDQQGYKNLMNIVSVAHMKGFYYKPRIDLETLAKYSEGLIATTACLRGPISKPLMNGKKKEALKNLEIYKKMFGEDLYIEIMRNGLEEQKKVNRELLQIARDKNVPIIATCDVHYMNKEDSELQEVLWAISDGKSMVDPTRRKHDTPEFYLKSKEEMISEFEDIPDAIENTQKIVDQIEEFDIEWGRTEPVYKNLPEGETPKSFIRKLTYDGAKEKYGEISDDLKERIEYELKIIDDKGYNDYFLIVCDFTDYCHENGIVIGMRGSGCGSVVAYSLGITQVEPIKWELYFERFLNYERASPPDFDIDVADDRRDELIQYTIDKFGEENVKQIGTFSKLKTRQAIRDVSRVLDIDLDIADQLSKMVDVVFGKAKSIDHMIENNAEFAQIINSSPDLMRMADIVRKITGVCRGVSTHACGIIIAPEPIVNYCPIQKDAHGEGIGMTQFDFYDSEAVGLMKFDFLGLRNLSVIGKTLDKIEKDSGERIDLLKIPYDDPKVFELLKEGHTVGVFQMESDGMKKVLRNLKPENIEEICYVLAAYRPGPMEFIPDYIKVKEGVNPPDYTIDALEEILNVTNGVITYQEQIMRILQKLSGYTLGAASVVMKAMSKKKMEKVQKEKPHFIEGGMENGFSEDDLEKVWDKLLRFANYGFNKAHSSSYAHVTYWTSYLKIHYPLEFMASLLESDLDNLDRVTIDLEECKNLGIDVLPPHVNKSMDDFTVEGDNSIRFGLAAIKNVGEDVCEVLVKERENKGEFLNFDDLVYRGIKKKIGKKVFEYLIKAGCMDQWGRRDELLYLLESVYAKYKKQIDVEAQGQMDLFLGGGKKRIHIQSPSPMPQVPPENKLSKYEKLQFEKELLGIYMSSHPLDQFEEFFRTKNVIPIENLENFKEGDIVLIGGNISLVKRITTKSGKPMAFVELEDKTGKVDIVVFPRDYLKVQAELREEVPVLFAGKVNMRNGKVNIIANKAKALNPEKHAGKFDGVVFKIRPKHEEEEIAQLKKIIKGNPGKRKVKIITYVGKEVNTIVLKNRVVVNDDVKKMVLRFS